MNDFELYKELYHKENERRQEVMNSLNIPIAIISALSTAIYFFITTFDYHVSTILNYFFLTFGLLSLLCVLAAIHFLVRAFISAFFKEYEYKGVPYVQDLYDWHQELKSHYQKYGGNEQDADHDFKTHLMKSLVKSVDHNMYINDKKLGFVFQSKRFLVLGLILTLLTLIPFGYNFFNKQDKPQKIELVSPQ